MKQIKLTDGRVVEIKINFLTLFLLEKYGLDKITKEINKPGHQISALGEILYTILRSNGEKLTKEDALALFPMDDSNAIFDVLEEYKESMEQFKKKADYRENTKKMNR